MAEESVSRALPTANIAAHVSRMAVERPYAPAIFFPDGRGARGRVRYTHYTYRQLDEASDNIAKGLASIGLAPQTRTALMVRPSLELFSLVFGLFKAGLAPVMIDPGIGLSNMKSCLRRARPQAFIGIPAAQVARTVLRWSPDTIKTVVTVGSRGPFGGHTLSEIERRGARESGPAMVDTKPADLAAILFTSGSTGPPKGAVYSHGNFMAQVDAIGRMYSIQPGEIDLPTFPLFALFDPALGMTTVIPDMDPTKPAKADPAKIAGAIEDFGVTNMFGSPALLNALGRFGERTKTRLPSLRRVISAGAPVPSHVLRRIRGMMPDDGQVVTPYGATECLPVASIESREVLGETETLTAMGRGVCVGTPVPEADVLIVEISDQAITDIEDAVPAEPGEVGEITVRGPQASLRYWDDPYATSLAKIQDGEQTRHRMGDLGYLDEAGRLWFCGRKSQRVQVGSKIYFTAQVEGIFNSHPNVSRSALVTVAGGPLVCLELEPGCDAPPTSELLALAEAHEAARGIRRFEVHPGFPVDIRHNAKIKREQLGRWAASR
ncbi:MAG TPA: peptide synthase [Polyangiaceae bacterium]|nr:peptide synthase [Polyangiaceae bacterium]